LHGDPPKRELDTPVVETRVHNLGTNNRGAFVPLSSLKYVLLDSHAPSGAVDIARYQRIAIHFVDHEVLRGYSDRQLRTSRYGVTLSLVSPDQSEVKDLAIPFTALKGIFYLKTWEGGEPAMLESDWVPRILEAREQEQVVAFFLDLDVPPDLVPWFESAVDCCAFLAWNLAQRESRVRFCTQEVDWQIPEQADVYTILKYLAIVSPRQGSTLAPSNDRNVFHIVFSASPERLTQAGWQLSRNNLRLLTPEGAALGVSASSTRSAE